MGLDFLSALLALALGAGATGVVSLLARWLVEPSPQEVKAAEASVEAALATVDEQKPSGAAQPSGGGAAPNRSLSDAEVQRILVDYAEDLLDESTRIARRAGAERPSAVHVRLAADRIGILRQRASVLADIGLGVGGLALGAALGFFINLATGGTTDDVSARWAVGVGAAGLAVFVVCATVKWLRR